MGKLLCEKNLRDVWCRNESVRAEIGPILQTHTHTRVSYSSIDKQLFQHLLAVSFCNGLQLVALISKNINMSLLHSMPPCGTWGSFKCYVMQEEMAV